jgi:hypothetical protein
MTTARALASAALLVAMAGAGSVPAGCAGREYVRRPDVTGGRRIEMFVSGAERRYERYLVGVDGWLHWGGGANAESATYTWSGPLTADEIARLFGAIERDAWFDRDPPSTKEPPDTVYSVQIRRRGGRESFTVAGDTEGLVEVHAILAQAALRRLDGYLETLPQPGRHDP